MGDAKSDCDELLNFVLPIADSFLMAQDRIRPFGGYIRSNGEIDSIGVGGLPDWNALVAALKDLFRERASHGLYKATAVVYHMTLSSGPHADAVVVCLDHRDSYSVLAIRPYTVRKDYVKGIEVSYGETRYEPGEGTIFTRSAGGPSFRPRFA